MVCRDQGQCCPRKLSVHSTCFGHRAIFCTTLHNIKAWAQQIDLNHSHYTCLKWSQSCPPDSCSCPHLIRQGGKGQGQLMTMSPSQVPVWALLSPPHLSLGLLEWSFLPPVCQDLKFQWNSFKKSLFSDKDIRDAVCFLFSFQLQFQ